MGPLAELQPSRRSGAWRGAARRVWLRVVYAFLRAFYACMAAVVVGLSYGAGPWIGFVLVLALTFAVTRVEDFDRLNSFCNRLASTQRWRTAPFLRHPEDVHTLTFILVLACAYGAAFWMFLHPDESGLGTLGRKIGFVLGAGTMLGWASGVSLGVCFHNHLHCGIFNNRALNRWLGRFWTVLSGWPAYFWQHKHLAIHHKHVGKDCDWVQPSRNAHGTYEPLLRYVVLHWPWRYAYHFLADFRGRRSGVRKRMAFEFGLFFAIWLLPFYFHPGMALGVWAYSHWVGSAFILGCGMYTQHVGGTNAHRHSHSTTFLSGFFNLTMFNVGYHTEHHACPLRHWADLPLLHDEMREELIAGGCHVVSYGSYTATRILGDVGDVRSGLTRFLEQHPDYLPQASDVVRDIA
jgi:fatty acid desaturase